VLNAHPKKLWLKNKRTMCAGTSKEVNYKFYKKKNNLIEKVKYSFHHWNNTNEK